MYSQQDEITNKRKRTIRLVIVGVIFALFFAADVILLVMRQKIPMIAVAIVGIWICYFLFTTQVYPYFRYTRFLRDIKEGLSRETTGWFVSLSPDTVPKDGVFFHPFVMRVGDDENDMRQMYWDDDKPLPELSENQQITVTCFGNYVIDIQTL